MLSPRRAGPAEIDMSGIADHKRCHAPSHGISIWLFSPFSFGNEASSWDSSDMPTLLPWAEISNVKRWHHNDQDWLLSQSSRESTVTKTVGTV